MLISIMLFFASAMCTYFTSRRVANNFFHCERESNLATLILLYLLPSLYVLFAGFLSVLNSMAITIFSLLVAICIFYFLKNKKNSSLFSLDIPDGVVGYIFTFTVIYYFLNSILGTVWISLDDSTYHAAIPATWVQAESFFTRPLTYQGDFPLNGSLFSTFFLVFFKTEYAAAVSEILLSIILLQSARLHDQRDKDHFPIKTLLACFILFVTDVEKYFLGFSDSDILPGILFYSSFVLLTQQRKSNTILGFLLVGFCLGIKLTNLFFSLPFLWISFRQMRRYGLKLNMVLIFWFLALSMPWYLKNYFINSNPVFPFSKLIFNGIFTEALTSISSLRGTWASLNNNDLSQIIFGFFGWQQLSFVLPLLIGINTLMIIFTKKHREITFLFLSFLGGLGFLIVFWSAPFSAYNESFGLNTNSSRYLLPLYIPTLLIGSILVKKSGLAYLLTTLVLIFSLYPRISDKKIYVSFAMAGIIFLLLRGVAKKINLGLILGIFIFVAIVYSGGRAYEAKKKSIWYLKYLDSLSGTKRITMYTDFIFRGYYLHGEAKNHYPVRLDYNGESVDKKSSFEVLRNYIYPAYKPRLDNNFCSTLVSNLIKNKIDLVVFEKDKQNKFPSQLCDGLLDKYKSVYEHPKGIIVSFSGDNTQ